MRKTCTLGDPRRTANCLCWEEGVIPKDMRDATIVTLYQSEGGSSDCNNCRDILLLSIVGKVFVRILFTRLQIFASRIYPKSQCGFRAGKSIIDTIFTVLRIQEKCWKQGKPFYPDFIDLTKASDFVTEKASSASW